MSSWLFRPRHKCHMSSWLLLNIATEINIIGGGVPGGIFYGLAGFSNITTTKRKHSLVEGPEVLFPGSHGILKIKETMM